MSFFACQTHGFAVMSSTVCGRFGHSNILTSAENVNNIHTLRHEQHFVVHAAHCQAHVAKAWFGFHLFTFGSSGRSHRALCVAEVHHRSTCCNNCKVIASVVFGGNCACISRFVWHIQALLCSVFFSFVLTLVSSVEF